MKMIKIRGGEAIVDDDVYDWLGAYKWALIDSRPARSVSIGKNFGRLTVYMSHVIAGAPSDFRVILKNKNSLDLRRDNLEITHPDGHEFLWKTRRNTDLIGVSWNKEKGLWESKMGHIHIDYHVSVIEAAQRYNREARLLRSPPPLNDLKWLYESH